LSAECPVKRLRLLYGRQQTRRTPQAMPLRSALFLSHLLSASRERPVEIPAPSGAA
jgi:hypothetical protein